MLQCYDEVGSVFISVPDFLWVAFFCFCHGYCPYCAKNLAIAFGCPDLCEIQMNLQHVDLTSWCQHDFHHWYFPNSCGLHSSLTLQESHLEHIVIYEPSSLHFLSSSLAKQVEVYTISVAHISFAYIVNVSSKHLAGPGSRNWNLQYLRV